MFRLRRKKPEPAPSPRVFTANDVPVAEIVEGWGQNPINVMPGWSEVRRNAAFALTDDTTHGFVLLRVRRSDLPGVRDRVVVDGCVMPYQREVVKDALEDLWQNI